VESSKRNKHLKQYFRLTITYTDGESSGRVFHKREQAEKYAARQKKSPFVKEVKVEAFTTEPYARHKSVTARVGSQLLEDRLIGS